MHRSRTFLGGVVVALASFLALVSTDQSRAQAIPDVCKIYFAGKSEIPDTVDRLMRERRDSAAEACLDGGLLHRYSSVSAAFLGSFNVCSYIKYETRNFDDIGSDITNEFFRHHQETWTAIAGPNCPAQDDPRYIASINVSDGVFIQLKRFADQIASSPKNFDAAFAADAKRIRCGYDSGSLLRPDLAERKEQDYRTLRDRIPTTDARSRFRLRAVGLHPGGEVFQGGYVFRQCSGYALSFSDPLDGNKSWSLYVEFTPAGLKVIGYDLFIA
jgi:hypothetical protein